MERKRLDDNRLSFLDAIGIPPARVEAYDLSYEKTGGLTTVIHRLTLTDLRPSCPNCGCLTPRIHSYTDKRIKHTSLSGKHSRLYLHHRRYMCPQCRKTYYEHNPFVIRASQKISKDVVYSILDSLREPSTTFSSAAEDYGVSVTTVMNIFDTHVRMTRSVLGEYLSIDENHCFGRGADAYVCVLLDFRTQEPIDILPNRHKDELIRYFRSIPWEERNRVKAVCIDMYPIYRDAVRVTFPEDVKVCVDHFHLIKEFTQQADEVRLSVMRPIYRELQRLRREKRKLECLPDAGTAANREHIQTLDVEVQKHSRSYYLLKKFHWMIFKDPNDEIFDPGRGKKYNPSLERYMNFHEIREALCNISPVLCEVINVRGRLVELYKCPSGEEGSEKLYELIGDLRHSGIQGMRHFAGTLERWSLEILNSLDSIERYYEVQKDGGVLIRDRRIHNGIIERKNRVIKLVENTGNGYQNFDRFRNRLLYVLRKQAAYAADPVYESLKIPADSWKKEKW